MRVKYTEGPSQLAVGSQIVDRGQPVEVSDTVGQKLIEQGWREVKASKPKEDK